MNKRQKRQLVRKTKMTIVCFAALYMASGIRVVGTEGSGERMKVYGVQEYEAASEVSISEETHETVETGTEEILATDTLVFSRDWGAEESYLLAKIAMAEAEGEDLEGKALVVMVVLNRVWSEGFPDSIEEVIYQQNQFSPLLPGGRWWTTEPDAECWKAVEMVQTEGWDKSHGATYFESEGSSQRHKNNLEFLFQHGNHYFYTDKEN